MQISDAGTGKVLDTETISSFTSGVYLDWKVSGNLLITITRHGRGQCRPQRRVPRLRLSPPPPTATASFLKQDATTQGSWIDTYGAQGYDIVSGPSKPARRTTPSRPADSRPIPGRRPPQTRAPCRSPARPTASPPSGTPPPSFTVDVNLADGQTHDLELYFDDWDNKGRGEQVQISDAGTGKVLDTETISSFTNGVYLDWKVSGNLVITITRTAGANAVLNGLFLDSTSSPPPDRDREFPQAGRDDAGELDRHLRQPGLRHRLRPVKPARQRHRHAQRTVDLYLDHDLFRPARLAGPRLVQPRRRRLVLRRPSFTVDVNLADGQAHNLELYFLDWDNNGRGEQVQISDAGTGTVLDTETISSFTSGVYLDWKVSGNLVITITRTAGANAVLNGVFLDPPTSSMANVATFIPNQFGGRSTPQTRDPGKIELGS